jgi:hypothetical protein
LTQSFSFVTLKQTFKKMKFFYPFPLLFIFVLSSCTKPLPVTPDMEDSTITEPPIVQPAEPEWVISETSADYGGGVNCGYDSKTRKLAYFRRGNSIDSNKLFYNKNGQLSYLLLKTWTDRGWGYEAQMFRHDALGRVSKVIIQSLTSEVADTNRISPDQYGHLDYDSLVYDNRNNLTGIYKFQTPGQYPLQSIYKLSYDDSNHLIKVVATYEAGGNYSAKDSIAFSDFSDKINPFYRDFKFYPLLNYWYYLIYFMPYGALNEFMTLNKYLPNKITTISDGGFSTRYVMYTFNEDSLPTRYYLSYFSWGGYYFNYTACKYIRLD